MTDRFHNAEDVSLTLDGGDPVELESLTFESGSTVKFDPDGSILGDLADTLTYAAKSVEYSGSITIESPPELYPQRMTPPTDFPTTSPVDDDDPYGVPECPECGENDAVQLSTDEWVCANACGLFEVADD